MAFAMWIFFILWAQERRSHCTTQRDQALRRNICCLSTHPPPHTPSRLLPIPCAKPKCLTQPTSGWISSTADSVKTQTVPSLRTEFWTFTKSLSWISLSHQAGYFSAIGLRHETTLKSADTSNQTHLTSTVKRNINFHGCNSLERSDVWNISTHFLIWQLFDDYFVLGVGFCVFLYCPSFESDWVTLSCPDYTWFLLCCTIFIIFGQVFAWLPYSMICDQITPHVPMEWSRHTSFLS